MSDFDEDDLDQRWEKAFDDSWLDDDFRDHQDGFRKGATLINTLVKKCMGETEIPENFYSGYLAYKEELSEAVGKSQARKLFVLDKPFGLTPKQVHAAFAEHVLQLALEAHAISEVTGDPDYSALYLAIAGFNIGQSVENEDELLLEYEYKDLVHSQGSASGGKIAAKNRAQTRKKVREKSKEYILKRYLWNDGTQTIKSITDSIWAEIQTAMDSGNEWQGISNNDLLQAKIGRQSVYDAVKETAPC